MIRHPSELPGYPVAVSVPVYSVRAVSWGSNGWEYLPVFASHSRQATNQVIRALQQHGITNLSTSIGQPGLGNFWPSWAVTSIRASALGREFLWGWSTPGAQAMIRTALGELGVQYQGVRLFQ